MKKTKKQKDKVVLDKAGGVRLITKILGKSDEDSIWTASLEKVEELVRLGLYEPGGTDLANLAALDFVRKHPGVQFDLWDWGQVKAEVAGLWIRTDADTLDPKLINDFLIFTARFGREFSLVPNDLWVAF
jgi:hypothetical protein